MIQQPITGIAPPVVASPVAPGLGIDAGGVRLPTSQLASVEAPEIEVAEERPITRAGSEKAGNTFLPKPVAPVVPVRPRKQARH